MKRIYTYGHALEERALTIADMRDNKAAGRKMTQVTAQTAAEAAIIADQGIDMIITGSDWYPEVRKGAPTTFITAALFAGRYVTNEEILAGAIEAAMQGADCVLTPRSLDVVEMIANQGIAVQGHVGMVPSKSIQLGGMRTVGKTADEALALFEDMRRLEDAGAFGCEVECVAEDALAAISQHTSLITSSIGAGPAGDVIFLFLEDICGETENPPRHAQSWGDGAAILRQLDQERRRAVQGFKQAVDSGAYPASGHTVSMRAEEKDKLLEALDKRG
ncbi:3-methyl-2-oxobutanoate hydroxymethyltransferase [Thalassorhabdomicrobium marinisediminis]|uniref:3-methyl-2-oxobutanoate hydroxymethyltransferase n=1 Tax=Thalassorhabdomicrobium marinisediminis TaxID=2170577 RepID=UPI00249071EA|nr:3-methyl-2-oxobutanoate hydroxymethyltransferase [Thalassorhabdomicrobium marinisediminis]